MVWPLDRQVLNEEWLQRGNSWMKNVVYCRLCICAGRAVYSDLTSFHRGPFAGIWSASMERQIAWEKAWKSITSLESCALSKNADVYIAYDHSWASAMSWKCFPLTGLRNLLKERSSLRSSWAYMFPFFKVPPKCFPFALADLQVHELLAVKLSI